jgi:hypothetical protein
MNTKQFIEELKAFQKRTDEIIKELSAEKPQELTRETGMPKLNKETYWIDTDGEICESTLSPENDFEYFNSFNSIPEAETERDYTLASRRVRASAKAVNGDWKADWGNERQIKWGVTFIINNFRINCYRTNNHFIHQIAFPSQELATKFLELFRPELEILANP